MGTVDMQTVTLRVLTPLAKIREMAAKGYPHQLECETLPTEDDDAVQVERHTVYYRGPHHNTGGIIRARNPSFDRDIELRVHETLGGQASVFMTYSRPAPNAV